jgi:uncharacterized protein (TIGR03435 family)
MQGCLQTAFRLPGFRIVGGAEWFRSQRYDIVATIPPNTSDDKVLQMFQRLLIDRFKLAFHWEERLTSVYAMIRTTSGPKLKPAAEGEGASVVMLPLRGMTARNKSMDDPAGILSLWADRPVVNMTDLDGNYDLNSTGGQIRSQTKVPRSRPGVTMAALDALSSLGLKAEPRKLPVRFLVIDHVERYPTPD